MRNLFLFLWKYNFFLLFLFMESVCVYLIVRNNNFQRASVLNSAGAVSARVQTVISSITQYINLKNENDALARENSALRTLIPDAFYLDSVRRSLVTDSLYRQQYEFLPARVIANSVNRRSNYLTLDKGSRHGIRPEMGVICSDGVVGIVKDVSENFCSVMSVLHKDMRLSSRIRKNGYVGSLVWDGFDPWSGNLKEIARHVNIQPGDTVVTSAYSAIFPEGILIGRIASAEKKPSDNFYSIRVRLSTPFASLSHVYIVSNLMKEEQRQLEALQVHDH
jgi:rod shape-determining protein MreC